MALVLSALSMITVPAQARVQPGVWAFMHADDESAAESYKPKNRAGVDGEVTRTGDGRYVVDLTAEGAAGVPMVTAFGGNGVHCQLASFSPDVRIHVDCYQGPVLTDSEFMLTFFSPPAGGEAGGAYGYVFSGQPAATYPAGVEVLPETDQGVSTVLFHDGAFVNPGGNVQVSAVGNLPARCAVVRWREQGPDMVVEVKCQNLSDQSSFRPQWTLVYTHQRSIIGGDSGFFGYLHADQPSLADYVPNPERNLAPLDFKHRVTRSSDGRYQVLVHGPLTDKVTVHVSANGDTGAFCGTANVRSTPTNTERGGTVDVACFDAAGRAVDSKFTLNYYSP